MDTNGLIATIVGILTAGGATIKIFGSRRGADQKEIDEQLEKKTSELSGKLRKASESHKGEQAETDRRIKEIERTIDHLKGSFDALKENYSRIDSDIREQYGSLSHEISRLENELSVSLRSISDNVGYLRGKIESVG